MTARERMLRRTFVAGNNADLCRFFIGITQQLRKDGHLRPAPEKLVRCFSHDPKQQSALYGALAKLDCLTPRHIHITLVQPPEPKAETASRRKKSSRGKPRKRAKR